MTDTYSNPVRRDVDALADDLQHVTVHVDAIDEYADEHADRPFPLPDWEEPFLPPADADPETVIDFFVVGNALNYCFHHPDGTKFEAEYDGREWRGSAGMWACLRRTLEDSDEPNPLDPDVLASLPHSRARDWFAPSNDVPMPFLTPHEADHARAATSRSRMLRTLGQDIPDEYDAFHEAVLEFDRLLSTPDSPGLVDWLTDQFRAYDDVQLDLNAGTIAFNKRAQLAAAMIYDRFEDDPIAQYPDVDNLTVFADYGVPAVLRAFGMIEYDPALAHRIDQGWPVEADSRVEIEIRAATVLAGDRLISALNARRADEITAAEVDYHLWKQRREMDVSTHYTATDAY